MTDAPDALRRTVAVGVTGHRVLAEVEKVSAGVEQALEAIECIHPDKSMIIYSSLAEGADRLIARMALRRPGARLVVPLPLRGGDYEADFASPESRLEFAQMLGKADRVIDLPAAADRDAAYNQAGDYIVEHSEILIAVWDGQPAQGRAGTSRVVERARRLQRPLAWVHAGNRRPGTMEPVSLGAAQGQVTLERF